jgi:hypothetical protein
MTRPCQALNLFLHTFEEKWMADVRQAAVRMGDGVVIYIDSDGRVRTSEGFFKAIRAWSRRLLRYQS